jgi:hypothetical protein
VQTPLDYDLKNYRAADYEDGFQLIPSYTAGYVLLVLVLLSICLAPVLA